MVDLLAARVATDRAIVAKGTLYDFFAMVWPMIDPAPLTLNWHLEEKCKHLEAVSAGLIRKLIINEPPGFGKSNTVNVIWNAWEWVKRPQTKFLYASFDASLVGTRDGGKVIKLLQSDWFRLRWGDLLSPGKPAASWFETKAGGFRFSTSPGGKGTGRHANIRVVDDPNKPKDVSGGGTMTRTALRAVSEWAANTLSSRATDLRTVRDVLIMQRLHEDDLAGEMLAKGGWVHLCLPMVFDPASACFTEWSGGSGGDRRTFAGELLFPERAPQEVVDELKNDKMGPDVFEAQCQQNPVRPGGTVFRREWWKFWHYREGIPAPCLCDACFKAKRSRPGCPTRTEIQICRPLPPTGYEAQSWDCTFKKTDTTDPVAGGVFRVNMGGVYLVDCKNERASFTDTVQSLRVMSLKWPHAYDKLIEDKANGPAVENALRAEIPGLTLVNPQGGKEARANAGSIYFSGGKLFLPHPDIYPWVWSYMTQHESFPRGVNDDMVDMTSQLLVRLKAHSSLESFAAAMKKLRGES
jgi:predicted phage terminase large subunit-like protein